MPRIKSQIKRMRQSERRRIRNKSARSEIKTYINRFRKAVEAGDKALAESELKLAVKKLDKAAEKGIIHKNNAANKKSSLMRRFNRIA
mgnify:CR=1 FL=1